MKPSKNEIASIDQYIRQFPEQVQAMLSELRSVISRAAPHATEKISYQMPCFYLHGNLVYFAAYKQHIGFYPTQSGIEAFQDQLEGYKSSKGSIQFPLDQPLPLKLVKVIVEFRVRENSAKPAKAKPVRDKPRR